MLLALFLVGCVSSPQPVQEMSFVTRERSQQQGLLGTIDSASVPDSHFEYSYDRSAGSYDYKLREVARFSELYLEAKQGRLKAIWRVGGHYYDGISPIQKNYQEAVRWYTMGADRDDPDCLVALGECYALGHGVSKDQDRAKALLSRASSQGKKSHRVTFSDKPVYYDPETGGFSNSPSTAPSVITSSVPQGVSASGLYEVTFDPGQNGKASWQVGMREFSGKVVRTTSKEVQLKVLTAKASMVLAFNKVDLHLIYGTGNTEERYEKYKVLLLEARAAQKELRDLVNLYAN
jgi:hypothetical protein